jgi:hypothetical protein
MAVATVRPAQAQSVSDCIEELLLDYQKLAGMKSTLTQMYNGYAVLSRGYNAVKGVSMDNFNLNRSFLNAQLLVSTGVRAYPRTTDIIRNAQMILGEYQAGKKSYGSSDALTPAERQFISGVYGRVTQAGADNLDELNRVTTDSKTRMTDAERLAAIDRLYKQSQEQLSYLRKFNGELSKTIRQRRSAAAERQTVGSLYQ